MRCPSCGTDNTPDSRFCGGCGTRFAVSGQRVAPTQKISDDASFPQRQLAPGAGSAVPVTAPGVVAPRAIPAAPFLPQGAPPAQRPFAGGSAAPVRPSTTPPLAPAPRAPEGRAPAAAPAPPSPRPSPRPQAVVVDDPSLSLPIAARRPWALIAVVLLIDLGLAAAGVWMLTQGLVDRPSRPAPPRSGGLTVPAGTASFPPRPS
jgi:eukaryotic-like serine/threonine-protein kinase